MTTLVNHARKELELVGEDPEDIESFLKVVQAFSDMDHSGFSAEHWTQRLERLLRYKNLSPLTNDPYEWMLHPKEMWNGVEPIWQNNRNPEAFSHDGGTTYYLLTEDVNSDSRRPLHTSIGL